MHPGWRSVRVRWALVALVATAILAGSLTPAPDGSTPSVTLLGVGADKWLHAAGYAILAWLVAAADRGRPLVAVALAVAAYGLLVETLQVPVPTRAFSALDAAANAAGAATGVAARRLTAAGSTGSREGSNPR